MRTTKNTNLWLIFFQNDPSYSKSIVYLFYAEIMLGNCETKK